MSKTATTGSEEARHTKDSKKNLRVPSLRLHKASGQAYVVLSGKAIYFGPHGTPQAEQEYHQVIAEWLAAGRQLPTRPEQITIGELIGQYWLYAIGYYVKPNGENTWETANIRQAMRPLRELYGSKPVCEFGPRALRVVRQRMIDRGWCRNNINKMVARIKRMFHWATAQELVGPEIYQALRSVPGLRRGRSAARETEPIKPVSQEHIDAVQPYVSQQVWTMIQLQLLTGARSGELAMMRPCDIDHTDGKIWVYIPADHKTAHQGYQRRIYIGPCAQKLLAPFLLRKSDAYCFSPAEARAEYLKRISEARKTPPQQGNAPGTNRKANPKKQPGEYYAPASYGHAISKAIKKAYRPDGMSNEEFKTWKPPQHWHPHQLRHNAATELRKEFGLEAARIILGHHSAAITEVYAEKDEQQAIEAMVKVG